MGKRYHKIVVTGSDSGSQLAWNFIRLLLNDEYVKTTFISPNAKIVPKSFDGLIITGGVDINPKLYNQKPHHSVKRIEPKRDKLELSLLERATKENIPIFGICRGMQLINVFFGGDLVQNIHDLNLKYPHSNSVFPFKKIKIIKNTKLHKIINKPSIYVNSIHHQAINKVGKGLKINSYDRNKIVEGIESTDKSFLIGVQWHPEYMIYKKDSRKLFFSFKKAVLRGSTM